MHNALKISLGFRAALTALTLTALALLLSTTRAGAQTNCSVFKDSAHIKACRLYNATDSFAQGSRLCQYYLDSAIRICPDYAEAWREFSVPYLKRGDFLTWSRYMDRAVSLQPRNFLGIRGWCYFKFLHDFNGALRDLQRLDTLTGFNPGESNDGSHNLYIVMALCERELGRYDAALHYFTLGIDSVRAQHDLAWVGLYSYIHRAVLYMRTSKFPSALADIDVEIGQYPNYAESYYYKGLILRQTGHAAEARAALQHARLLLSTGEGYHFSDPYCEMPDQVNSEDIDAALTALLHPTP
jgi:tetratricopeptide (TPR) repeat protein